MLKAAKLGGKLAFRLYKGLPAFGLGEAFDAVKERIAGLVTDPEQRKAAIEAANELRKEVEKGGKRSVPREIAEFRALFEELIERADVDRIVVLVDDLDRCLPDTAIETLEAIRLFVLMYKTAFVVGADERMIEYAVGRHFPNLPRMEDAQGYARAYLEKLLHPGSRRAGHSELKRLAAAGFGRRYGARLRPRSQDGAALVASETGASRAPSSKGNRQACHSFGARE